MAAKPLNPSPDCDDCPLGRASLPEPCPFRERVVQKGAVLVRQGLVPLSVTRVKSGAVLVAAVGPAGEDVGCATRGEGAMLGLEALTGATSSYQASAQQRTTVCTASAGAFRTWVGDLGSRAGTLLDLVLRETRRREEERVTSSGSATSRVARYLLDREQNGGARVTFAVIARMLRMRPETLSRAIAQLREDGVVSRGKALEILDRPRLVGIAERGA
ncbi:MAG: Crp/Fnr family transcriptional regulator [Polyangiaceae bacterium]|nr:Crp/Fnr family transcriptional regulator [Polyangiaceae bacterium]